MDGLDICYVKFRESERVDFEIISAQTINYSEELIESLRLAHQATAEELAMLDTRLGILMGAATNQFIRSNNITQIDAIASHGHTIFHNPGKGYTTQIGHPAHIYAATNIKTIADFRTVDVALGGQGAPLVPIGDKLLFPQYKYCLNLGGIANVSLTDEGERIAFDVVVCNMALNYLANQAGKPYDDDGMLAAAGKVDTGLLNEMNQFDFFQKVPPKSLGREQFEAWYLPLLDTKSLSTETKLKTVVEHIGMQIGTILGNDGDCLVTGGGAFNPVLIESIRRYSDCNIQIPDKITIAFKEALIFALLGYLRITGKINTLKSVTGADRDSVGGAIYG